MELYLTSAGESIFQLFVVLIIFIGVLAATYYITKWIAGYQKAQQFNRNLEVVETLRITNNKFVQIIRAGDNHYYVIALGKDEVVMLGEISGDDLKDLPEEEAVAGTQVPQLDFKSILEKLTPKK